MSAFRDWKVYYPRQDGTGDLVEFNQEEFFLVSDAIDFIIDGKVGKMNQYIDDYYRRSYTEKAGFKGRELTVELKSRLQDVLQHFRLPVGKLSVPRLDDNEVLLKLEIKEGSGVIRIGKGDTTVSIGELQRGPPPDAGEDSGSNTTQRAASKRPTIHEPVDEPPTSLLVKRQSDYDDSYSKRGAVPAEWLGF